MHVTAPEGSILNCLPPAPVASRHLVGHFIPGLIFAALEPVLGERRPAGGADSIWISVWTGAAYNLTLFQSGGAGARHGRDGMSATGFPSAVASVPTEVLELAAPVVQRERSLRVDSGGAGRWRGGLGQTSVVTGGGRVSVLADRISVPAPGAFGGSAGAPGALSVPAKRLIAVSGPVRFDLPGGGGFGSPLERDPEAVLGDVLDGYVSREAAAAEYGVVVGGDADALVVLPGDLYVDEDATARLREEMR